VYAQYIYYSLLNTLFYSNKFIDNYYLYIG